MGFKFQAYRGGPVDGPETGAAPPPWAVACDPSTLFKDQVKSIEVPHTSVIRVSHVIYSLHDSVCVCFACLKKIHNFSHCSG